MRLEIDSVTIKNVKAAEKTHVQSGNLYVNVQELKNLILEDDKIKSVDIRIVAPGDSIRILNVQDFVQPRCKLDKEDADFPGFLGKMQLAGSGKTLSLNGVGVCVCIPETTRVESGMLDMAGEMATLTPYAKMHNVCIAPYGIDGLGERELEDVVKLAGFKTAVYLARAARNAKVDDVEVFDSDCFSKKHPRLPRVALYFQVYSPQFDYLAVSDRCIYGSTITNMLPTIIHPNEVLDGGIVGWNALKAIDTYSMQNHAVIKELYKHHGKDLNFVGVCAATATMTAEPRMRNAYMSVNLIKNFLGADGAVVQKILGGMPHADIGVTSTLLEQNGVKTSVFTTPLTDVGTLADTALFNNKELDLIIAAGAPFEKTNITFKAKEFFGGTPQTKIYSSEQTLQYAGDEKLRVEQYLIAGAHDHTGSRNIIVAEF